MNEEKLSGATAENVLTLLCFSDEYATLIRHAITPNLFESAVFRDIAGHAIDFIDQFKAAIKEHLADELEDVLKGNDKRKASSYSRVLDNLFLSKEHMNEKYVFDQLNAFVRQQKLKSALVRAVEAIEDGRVGQAEVELQKGLSEQIVAFEPGVFLSDPKQALKFLEHEHDGIRTGIHDLDSHDIMLRPQEMFMMIAPAKKGKSWLLTHLGKNACMQRKRVLHITLEMSERRCAQRYVQSFFSVSKRQAAVRTTVFKKDDRGHMLDLEFEEIERPSLGDAKIRQTLSKRIQKEFKHRLPLIIKQFPTGMLTVPALTAYLDALERFHKFIPDVLLIDYPDLMKVDASNKRIEVGEIFKDLRGIAVERNIALGTVTQGNRESSKARIVTDAHVAEDYSKIATADIVLTYNQTPEEKKAGLARLFVTNSRNDEDKFMVLISQAYAIGQFCLDSALMTSDYWTKIDEVDSK